MLGHAVFRSARSLAPLLGVGLLFVRCSDQTGPETRFAQLALVPTFESSAAYIIDVDSLRITLTRSDSVTIALDTVIGLQSDSVDLAVTVPLLAQTETFYLQLWIVDTAGDTVFTAGPDVVTASSGGTTSTPTPVTIVYVGVGSDAAGVQITTAGATVLFGETVTIDAVALDSSEQVIEGTPILFRTTDSSGGTFPESDVGAFVGGSVRGPVDVVAELLTGQTDTASVLVQPVPSELVVVSGAGQSGDVTTELTDPIVVQVNGSDGLGVQGVSVAFTTADGGTLTPPTFVTDAQGQASTLWALGPAPGTQSVTAAVVGLSGVEVNVTADAIQRLATDLAIVSGDGQTGPVGVELSAPLVVLATDDMGTPVAGTTVDWTVTLNDGTVNPVQSVTDASGLAQTAWTLGTVVGANSVTASLPDPLASPIAAPPSTASRDGVGTDAGTSALNVTFTATGIPVGVTRLWVGGSTDWADPSNWSPAIVPTPSDNVFIPSGAPTQPILTANQQVGDLLLEPGASVNVGPFTLTAAGNVTAVIGGTGTVVLAGAGKTVTGSFPNVSVWMDATLSGSMLVAGDLVVSGSGANLTLSGNSVVVSGNFTTQSGGVVTMTDGADVLDVTGNVTFGGGSTDGTLSDGVLQLEGNFVQVAGASFRFAASGAHKVVFDGTTAQTISFGNPGISSSRFQDLEITNTSPTGVDLQTNTQVNGDLIVTGSTVMGAATLTVVGDVTATSTLSMTGLAVGGVLNVTGTYSVTNTTFTSTGPQAIPPLAYTNVDVTGDAAFSGTTSIGGDLSVSGGGNLAVGGQTVTVAGAFSTNSGGALTMNNAADVLDVAGNVTFGGGSTDGTLSDGVLQLEGNFVQVAGASFRFAASGAHKVIFDGTASQAISFGNPGIGSSRFQDLEITNTVAAVSLSTNAQVNGDLTVTGGTLTGNATLTALGDVTVASTLSMTGLAVGGVMSVTGTYSVTNTTFTGTGPQAIPPLAYTNVDVTGDAAFSGTTSIGGDLSVSGSGNLAVAGQTVTVAGAFSTASGGVLTMTNTLDLLDVAGGATFGGGSTNGTLTAGALRLQGDLTQVAGASFRFAASGTHTVDLTGAAPQLISFGNPGSASSRFQDLNISNTSSASLVTSAQVNGTLTNTGTVDIQAGTLTLSGSFTHAAGAVLQGAGTLDLSGATILPAGSLVGDVSPGTSPGILNLTGDFPQDAGSTVKIELGGNVPGAGHDQLKVTGVATMNGAFVIDTANNYSPVIGDSLTVFTFASRTPFSSTGLSVRDLGTGIGLDTVSTPTSFDIVGKPQIVFVGDSGFTGTMTYYRINPSGLNRQVISNEGIQGDNYPRWNHDRTRITYSANPGLGPNQLHVTLANGSVVGHLTSASDTSTRRPRYNSDGTRIAFECGDGSSPAQDVCVTATDISGPVSSLDGIADDAVSGKVYLTDKVPTRPTNGPGAFAWHPSDPTLLAIVRDSTTVSADEASRIYTIRYDGSGLAPVSGPVMDLGNGPLQIVGTMDWSPDGLQLTYSALDRNLVQNIYVINSDGSNLTQLTANGNREFTPIFSPNSKEIMFVRDVSCELRYAIYNVSTRLERVEIPSSYTCDGGDQYVGHDWSPDGSQIVLVDGNANFSASIYTLPNNFVDYLGERREIARVKDAPAVTDIQPSWRR